MDYEELRRPQEAWFMDYEGPRRPLQTWNMDKERRDGPPDTWAADNEEQHETLIKPKKDTGYVTGIRLTLVIISISVVYFLNMLDTTVLATVRTLLSEFVCTEKPQDMTELTTVRHGRPSHISRMSFTQFSTSAGTAVHIPSQRK